MIELHDDDDVLGVPASVVVDAMRRAIRAHGRGRLEAPPRVSARIGDGRLVFTAGGILGESIGFRAYGVGTDGGDDQLVATWRDGGLETVVVGEQLGIRRTAGIGAVATDVLASPNAGTLGLIGAGRQGRAHVREVSAVRELHEVRVFSRTPARREETAAWLEDDLGLNALPVGSAEDAASGADLVTLATTSVDPVLDGSAIEPGAHVTTIGPKLQGRHELPMAIADRARLIATDSLAQVHAYPAPFFLADTTHAERVVELGTILDRNDLRDADDVTLFCSVGLAGTEPVLARAVADTGV